MLDFLASWRDRIISSYGILMTESKVLKFLENEIILSFCLFISITKITTLNELAPHIHSGFHMKLTSQNSCGKKKKIKRYIYHISR